MLPCVFYQKKTQGKESKIPYLRKETIFYSALKIA